MRMFRLFFLCLWGIGLALPVAAHPPSVKEIGKLRMEIAGRQQLLSQRIVTAACFLTLDIDHDRQMQILSDSLDLFRVSLDQLETSAPARALPPVRDLSTRLALQESRVIWGAYRILATRIGNRAHTAQTTDLDLLARLARLEPILLKSTQSILDSLRGTRPDPTDAQVVKIDLASRQRMLSQAIRKDSCLIAAMQRNPAATKSHLAHLLERTAQFEQTGFALRSGHRADTPPLPPIVSRPWCRCITPGVT